MDSGIHIKIPAMMNMVLSHLYKVLNRYPASPKVSKSVPIISIPVEEITSMTVPIKSIPGWYTNTKGAKKAHIE
jgi:hypothetical protein